MTNSLVTGGLAVNLATRLTLARLLLVPLCLISVANYRPEAPLWRFVAFVLFVVASVTDALDGYLAKRHQQQTELGTFLDPLADKFLLVSMLLAIFFSPMFEVKPPAWVVIVVVSRDVLLISGLFVLTFLFKPVRVRPSWLGKLTTVFQMLTIGHLLLKLPAAAGAVLWNATAVLTVLSGANYLWREAKRLNGTVV